MPTRRYVSHARVRDQTGHVVTVIEPLGQGPLEAPRGPLHPVLTVVVPARGRPELVAEAVRSVHATLRWPCAEVVVVDDASPEPVGDVPGATVLRLDQNVGFGAACDAGAARARGAHLLFLNSDAWLTPGCAEEMLEHACRGAWVVGARLLYPDGKLQCAGMVWDEEQQAHVVHGKDSPGAADFAAETREVEAVSGACMLARADRFRQLGGFGGMYGRGYFEDVDLCLRAWEAGGRVVQAGRAVAHHREHGTFGGRDLRQVGLAYDVFAARWLDDGRRDRVRAAVAARERAAAEPRVAVVVCVRDALAQVAECLSAASRDPGMRADLVVVDDASGPETARWLDANAADHGFRVVRLAENRGYLGAALAGIAATAAPWVCLLNSDTVPARGWLAKMMVAADSDPRVAAVNPACNNAANLSVPMPRGCDVEAAGLAAASQSLGAPVDVVYPVGMCLLLRRAAYEEVGGFDRETYPLGYGEETDLCERLLQAGWRCVLEPSAYVYHQSKASHGDRGRKMEEEAVGKFLTKHGRKARERLDHFSRSRAVEGVKRGFLVARPRDRRPAVTFYVNEASLCGGVLACYQITRRLSRRHGWRAVTACRSLTEHAAMEPIGLHSPLSYDSAEQFAGAYARDAAGPRAGALVATAWFTAKLVRAAAEASGGEIRPAYFVQDDEALFTTDRGELQHPPDEVHASYALVGPKVANSRWVAGVVKQHGGGDVPVIPVGVDPLTFYPREKYDRFTVIAMCRWTTPRRGHAVLSAAMREVRRLLGPEARLVVYGQMPPPADRSLMEHVGQLPQHRLADVMGRSHVLLEPSEYQGFGLPALEAMASGCVPISRANRGIDDYGVPGENCEVVAAEEMAEAVVRLALDRARLAKMAAAGRETAARFSWDVVAERWDDWLRREVLR